LLSGAWFFFFLGPISHHLPEVPAGLKNKSLKIKRMSSTSETGHKKNVANYEILINYCTGYGDDYSPVRAALKLPALKIHHDQSLASLDDMKAALTAYANATNTREAFFKPLRPFATRIVSSLEANGAGKETVKDARRIVRKMNGRRAKPVVIQPENVTPETPVPKKISVSQQSYVSLADQYAQLIELLAAEAGYVPNEEELTVSALGNMLKEIRVLNTAVIQSITNLSNARIQRNKLLYSEPNGVCAIAKAVKLYVKSMKNTTPQRYKQVKGIPFKRTKE
jgi:hypothetical protein